MIGKSKLVEMTEVITSNKNWMVPAGCHKIDVFLVGGGGGGAYGAGGGGYTKLCTGLSVTPGNTISCIIGKGGKAGGIRVESTNGEETSFLNHTALGGKKGANTADSTGEYKGGNGGSGGAGFLHANGGRDGTNGSKGTGVAVSIGFGYGDGGIGQGFSARCPFNGILYSSGGSTGRNVLDPDFDGGSENSRIRHGRPNTGDGGSGSNGGGGNGGSGIIILHYWKSQF